MNFQKIYANTAQFTELASSLFYSSNVFNTLQCHRIRVIPKKVLVS